MRPRKDPCGTPDKIGVVKHVRLHWNSWRWNYGFMYESFKYTERPDKKCQYSTKIFEPVVFELWTSWEKKYSTFLIKNWVVK